MEDVHSTPRSPQRSPSWMERKPPTRNLPWEGAEANSAALGEDTEQGYQLFGRLGLGSEGASGAASPRSRPASQPQLSHPQALAEQQPGLCQPRRGHLVRLPQSHSVAQPPAAASESRLSGCRWLVPTFLKGTPGHPSDRGVFRPGDRPIVFSNLALRSERALDGRLSESQFLYAKSR